MPASVLIRGGQVMTMDPQRRVLRGDVYVLGDRIAALGEVSPVSADVMVDAAGMAVIPGLIQTHIHLCQTLFRGQADDLELLDWLRQRIWPLEAALTPETLAASARLGCAELILGGTTTLVDMGTVHHTDVVFQAMVDSGLRGFSGKCMMDHGDEVPPGLRERTADSLAESLDLMERWDGAGAGRIRYCFAPRFAVSCSDGLLREVQRIAMDRAVLVHTHAAENRAECALVEAERGCANVAYFHRLGMTGPRLLLAHCVHLSPPEMDILAATGTRVAHCPSSNLKLASGIAPVAELRRRGVEVGIGADGAPCNNNLDGFLEMRLAALLQKVVAGPTALPAAEALAMATIGGARAVGLDPEIGSLEVGKKADLAMVDLTGLHCLPGAADDPVGVVSQLVYAARAGDVRLTMVDGRILMRDRNLLTLDAVRLAEETRSALVDVRQRAGLR